MKLPVLALFERSLRLETRSPLMNWSRAGFLALILFMLYITQSESRSGLYSAPGLHFLNEMVWVNFIFITLASLSYFASVITEEKEEMMLGLLRMTDLNSVSILLGKSTSRFVGALLLLLAQVPFVLLAVALGGVGVTQIAAAYSTLLAYLFFVCNLALLFSVVFRSTATAAGIMLLALLIFLLGHFWAAAILRDLDSGPGGIPAGTLATTINLWYRATPIWPLSLIFQTGFAGPVAGYQVASNLVFGIVFFLLAWLVFGPCTREEKEASPARRWFFRRTSRRSLVPAGLVGIRAIGWKDFTFISGGWLGLLVKFGVVAFVMALVNVITLEFGGRNNVTLEFESKLLIWISIVVTAVWLAVDAARVFNEEVRWKTLSSLAMLPVSIPELAYRKVAGTLAGTLPLLAGAAVGMILVPKDTADFFSDMLFGPSGEFGAFAVAIFQFILFLHLTAFLSLVVKRGALPLAITIQYVGGSIFLSVVSAAYFFATGGATSFYFFVCMFCIVTTIVLHRAIGLRLVRAAAEE